MAWEAIDISAAGPVALPLLTADLAQALNILTLNLSRAGIAHEAWLRCRKAVCSTGLAQIGPTAYRTWRHACTTWPRCLGDVRGQHCARSPRSREDGGDPWELAVRDPATRPGAGPCLHRLTKRLARPVTRRGPEDHTGGGRRLPGLARRRRMTSAGGSPARSARASVLELGGQGGRRRPASARRSEAMTEEDSIRILRGGAGWRHQHVVDSKPGRIGDCDLRPGRTSPRTTAARPQ